MKTVRFEKLVGSFLPLVVICLATATQAQTTKESAYAQGEPRPLRRPARLVVSGVGLREALGELHASSGVLLLFSPTLLSSESKVACLCADYTVAEALDVLLRGTSLDYQEMGDDIVIAPPARGDSRLRPGTTSMVFESALVGIRPMPSFSVSEVQQARIAGVVVNARGEPVAGAQVLVQGTANQAVTNQEGRFQIPNVTGTEVVLAVRRIGYRPLTQTVRVAEAEIRLVMVEAAINLDEIVVTGTAGGTALRALGNAVARVKASELVDIAPVKSVGDLLNGRVPGAAIMPGSGRLGSGPRIVIRGQSSLTLSSAPLVYVDGVRLTGIEVTGPDEGAQSLSRLADFNPDDIESIEVIKGPAAATLYGTEASNGVIQILTRKGVAGDGRPTWNLSVRQGAQAFMNAESRIEHNFYRDPATGQITEMNIFAAERELGRSIFRTGHIQGYNLSLGGGNNLIKYYSSIGFDRDEGIEPIADYGRLSGRVNLTLTPSPKFEVAANLGVAQVHTNVNQEGGPLSVMWGVLFAQPQFRNTPSRGFNGGPPEAKWAGLQNVENVRRYTAGLQFTHRPATWFSHRLNVGIDQTMEDNQRTNPIIADSLRQFLTGIARDGIRIALWKNLNVATIDYGGTGTARLGKAIEGSTSFGFQYYRNFTQTNRSEGRGFAAPGLSTVAGAATTFGLEDFVENTTVGVYLQQQFSLNNRLFLTGAVRGDDNSAFGEDFSLVTYPKVSAAWVVSEEPFFKLGFVNDLKLRAAYGESGRQPASFAALQTYRATAGSAGATVSPLALGNPDLGPERGKEVELGFDATLFNRGVDVEFTYYNKRTHDAILSRLVAPSSGFPEPQFTNVGLVSNKGMELQVNVTPVNRRSVRWNLGFSAGRNTNEIVELNADDPSLTFVTAGARTQHREGYSVGSFFDKKIVSATYNATTRRAENIRCDGGPGAAPVDCAVAPAVYLGRPSPTYEGAFTTDVTLFDRLQLRAQVDFKGGNSVFDVNNWVRCTTYQQCDAAVRPENYDPVYVAQVQTAILGPRWVEKTNFAKLRELSVSYAFSSGLVRRLGLTQARLTVAARNLHTWTNYDGIDPEAITLQRAELFSPQNQAITPQQTSVAATLNITW
jgi:TonB-linked SusC/RagA family outer membrane protein